MQRGYTGGNLFLADFTACDAYAGLEAAARKVTCPATLVLGQRDQMTAPQSVAPIVAALKPRVVTLPVGHNLMAEAPDGVLNAINEALTDEQARAVICFDNRVQVVASAGSGKTSTMVAKAAYAIHRGFVPPERVILLAFNKQAAEELSERAAKSFDRLGMEGVSVEASTFHALGLRIIGKATGEKPDIPDWATDAVSGFRKLTDIVDQLKDRSLAFRTQWDLFRFFFGRDLPPFGSVGSP
jgi:hypothetical protein